MEYKANRARMTFRTGWLALPVTSDNQEHFMKKIPFFSSLFFGVASVAITSSIAKADTLDTLFDYQTDTAAGQWSIWARNSTDSAICNVGSPHWDATNQNYVIDAQFSPGCGYMYFRLNLPHALDGTTALTANIKMDVIVG